MRTALIVAAGSSLLFVGLFVLTGHAWTAGAVASIVATLASTVVILRLLRQIPRPWVRRGTMVFTILACGLVTAQWSLAGLGRIASYQDDPQTARLLAHASIRSYAFFAVGGPDLLDHYYSIPESRRPAFGVAARQTIEHGTFAELFTRKVGNHQELEILPSPDSELVVRAAYVMASETGGTRDSIIAQGRLILTASGGRYVIDR